MKKRFFLVTLALALAIVACDTPTGPSGGGTPSTIAVTGVSLNKTSVSLGMGGTETLTATIAPSNATNKNVTWTSSNASVATVSTGGKITAIGAGTATITVTTASGSKTATCTVTVVPVIKVDFTGATATVNFNNLSNKDIYLVKVNTSASVVPNVNTGKALSLYSEPANNNMLPSAMYEEPFPRIRMGHPGAERFNANPPPIEMQAQKNFGGSLAPSSAYAVGDTKKFWVEEHIGMEDFVQQQATLRAQGTYGNIWVMDTLTSFTTGRAQALSDKFDQIYPIETSLLGYEYGGGPGGTGGKDGDARIQILVYDLGSGGITTLGFFWAKDYYEQSQLIGSNANLKTNLAEIFYINGNNSVYINPNYGPDTLYTTLVHEFQHMINFNQKVVKKNLNSATWYNEMLSQLAEDVISPLIGVGPSNRNHPIKDRIPLFLDYYYYTGVTSWGTSGDIQLITYSTSYAFGAYLLRNYGGASLLKEMLSNNSVNTASITAALQAVIGSGFSFEGALRRYGEAFVFSGTMPADVLSFDKTVTKTIGGYTYTANKFNIWNDFGSTKPRVFGANEQVEMPPYSIIVHQSAGWKNKSGNLSITLERPTSSGIDFYLMVK